MSAGQVYLALNGDREKGKRAACQSLSIASGESTLAERRDIPRLVCSLASLFVTAEIKDCTGDGSHVLAQLILAMR